METLEFEPVTDNGNAEKMQVQMVLGAGPNVSEDAAAAGDSRAQEARRKTEYLDLHQINEALQEMLGVLLRAE